MTSAEKRAQEILAQRKATNAESPVSGVLNGVPGWSYYVTFAGQTPERVRVDLRKSGYAVAGEEHAGVRVLSADGANPVTVELWCKPTALVQMDLAEERARRPRKYSLSAAGIRKGA